jgi:hypothetical protein
MSSTITTSPSTLASFDGPRGLGSFARSERHAFAHASDSARAHRAERAYEAELLHAERSAWTREHAHAALASLR